jgi:hypothetical protein
MTSSRVIASRQTCSSALASSSVSSSIRARSRSAPARAAASLRSSSSISDPSAVSFPPHTTVENQIAGHPEITQSSRSEVPSDELHPERNRVASTAEGGTWLLRTPRPEPVAELAGMRTVIGTSRYLSGRHTWQSSGIATQREIPVIDPGITRRLDVGQAAYLYRGGVTYLHVTPPAQAAADEPFTRVQATPALPWAPPRQALPRQASRRGPAPALPPSRADHQRPEPAITEPLPRIPPTIKRTPHPPHPPATPKASPPPTQTPTAFAKFSGNPGPSPTTDELLPSRGSWITNPAASCQSRVALDEHRASTANSVAGVPANRHSRHLA